MITSSSIKRVTDISSEPRALFMYTELIEQFNKIINIGSKILKKHQIKYSYIDTSMNKSGMSQREFKESFSRSKRHSRNSSIFKKSQKNYNSSKIKKKSEISKTRKSILKTINKKSVIRQSGKISRPKRENSKSIIKDRVRETKRGRTEEPKRKQEEPRRRRSSQVGKKRENSQKNEGYTVVDKIDLSGSVGRKLRHYYRKSGVQRRRVRTRYRDDVRATSFDVMDKIQVKIPDNFPLREKVEPRLTGLRCPP